MSPDVSNAELNALFSAGWPSPDTSDWHSVLSHSLVYICAYDGPTLIGFANVAWDGRDHAFLLDPRVHPDYRRLGVGRELVRLAAEAAGKARCEWLHVDWDASREGLTAFYRACKFAPTDAGLLRLRP